MACEAATQQAKALNAASRAQYSAMRDPLVAGLAKTDDRDHFKADMSDPVEIARARCVRSGPLAESIRGHNPGLRPESEYVLLRCVINGRTCYLEKYEDLIKSETDWSSHSYYGPPEIIKAGIAAGEEAHRLWLEDYNRKYPGVVEIR